MQEQNRGPTACRYTLEQKDQTVRLVRKLRAETGLRHGAGRGVSTASAAERSAIRLGRALPLGCPRGRAGTSVQRRSGYRAARATVRWSEKCWQ